MFNSLRSPWTAARQASLCLTISSPRACPSSRLLNQWCHPTISSSVALFSFCHKSFPASGSFTNESSYLHQVAKVLELSLTISLSNESSGLISLRLTDLISVLSKGLKSLLQHLSSKAAILRHSAFFLVQLSHLYMTTGKTIALTIGTPVTKVMSLFFNTLSRFVKVKQYIHSNFVQYFRHSGHKTEKHWSYLSMTSLGIN